MFARQVITTVMTALVLVCPYLPCEDGCDGSDELLQAMRRVESVESEPDMGGELEKADGPACCCHRPPEQPPRPPQQAPCGQDCPRGDRLLNCFCGGALVAPGVDCPGLDAGADILPTMTVDSMAAPRSLEQFLREARAPDASCHFPRGATGRTIREFAASFLL